MDARFCIVRTGVDVLLTPELGLNRYQVRDARQCLGNTGQRAS